LEPDECYYIANEPRVRGKDDLDLAVDPPPDLAIEIDISSSSIDQLAIYASLGVPEVWLCRGTAIHVYALQAEGSYERRDRSLAFPFLPPEGLQRFLDRRDALDENSLLREFVDWARMMERGEE
jgi:Uma2 family endonuclease